MFFAVTYAAMIISVAVFFMYRNVRVVDGDSFEVCERGSCVTYHLWGINAPELRREHARCDQEVVLGEDSKAELERILSRGFEIIGTHGETYGEPWATVATADGDDVSRMMMAGGHAVRHGAAPRWCEGEEAD